MKHFYCVFLIIFISVAVLGFPAPKEHIDNTEELSQNDKILVASLIDLSFLINKERLSPEKIRKLKIDDREIKNYAEKFSTEIKNFAQKDKISFLANKVKQNNSSFKDYVDSLIRMISEGNGKFCDIYRKWDSFTDNGISFILISKDGSKKYGFIIYKRESEKIKLFSKDLEKYQEFVSILPVKEDIFQKSPVLKNVIFAKKIFSNTDIKNIFIYPPKKYESDFMQKTIFVFNDREQNHYQKTGEKYLYKYNKNMVNQRFIFKLKLYHIIFHSIGPFFIKDKEGITSDKPLKELFFPIEELKAELMSYLFNNHLIKQGDIPPKDSIDVESNFITYLIDKANATGSIIPKLILNYLLKKGGITKDGEKIVINKIKFTPLLYLALKTVVDIESEGNYNNAEKFIKEHKAILN